MHSALQPAWSCDLKATRDLIVRRFARQTLLSKIDILALALYLFAALAGCASTRLEGERCGISDPQWAALDLPPADAGQLLADTGESRGQSIEIWFRNPAGDLMLCRRAKLDPTAERLVGKGCSASRWVFRRDTSGWQKPEYSFTWCHA